MGVVCDVGHAHLPSWRRRPQGAMAAPGKAREPRDGPGQPRSEGRCLGQTRAFVIFKAKRKENIVYFLIGAGKIGKKA